ncbi:UbiA family prenyltransferase [Cytophagales bacterium LB-30]|uniref:UbiA family prenyltransferase n=2 Tax=Shiella aurantiaca TaxID=3058365 RepID=A0ABT8F6V5_9BACT|nr:UbiA family prenyltransferase [Shiella aurantiaca]
MAALYYISGYQQTGGQAFWPTEAWLVMASTFIAYNFFRMFSAPVPTDDAREKEQWHLRWRGAIRGLCVLSLLLCLGLSYILFSWQAFLFLLHLGLISLCYNAPNNWPKVLQIRQYPFLKVFVVAYVWAMMAIGLPHFLHTGLEEAQRNLPILLGHFCFIVAITLPFDVKDWEEDEQQGLVTLPHRLGLKGLIALALFFLCLALFFLHVYSPWASSVTFLGAGLLIINTRKKWSEWFYTLGFDGTFLLYYLCLQILDK